MASVSPVLAWAAVNRRCRPWCLRRKRVRGLQLGRHFAVFPVVEENAKVFVAADALMVVTHRTDPKVVCVVLVGDHGLAIGTLVPCTLWDFFLLGTRSRDAFGVSLEPYHAANLAGLSRDTLFFVGSSPPMFDSHRGLERQAQTQMKGTFPRPLPNPSLPLGFSRVMDPKSSVQTQQEELEVHPDPQASPPSKPIQIPRPH